MAYDIFRVLLIHDCEALERGRGFKQGRPAGVEGVASIGLNFLAGGILRVVSGDVFCHYVHRVGTYSGATFTEALAGLNRG